MTSPLFETLKRPDAIRVEFQPMFRMQDGNPELYAVEALSRGPAGSSIERPDVMFEYARRKGDEAQLDCLCITRALKTAVELPGDVSISMNVHGSTVSSDDFGDKLLWVANMYGIRPERLILEIVEHRGPWVMSTFHSTLAKVRAAGVRIAVDDLGVGASNFRMVVDCQPDYLKIDRYVVAGCSIDPVRAAVIESIVQLAQSIGASPIAEGIETTNDLDRVCDLGVDIIQGWLFARPMPVEELSRSAYLPTQRIAK